MRRKAMINAYVTFYYLLLNMPSLTRNKNTRVKFLFFNSSFKNVYRSLFFFLSVKTTVKCLKETLQAPQ